MARLTPPHDTTIWVSMGVYGRLWVCTTYHDEAPHTDLCMVAIACLAFRRRQVAGKLPVAGCCTTRQ
eukprot:15071-Eustigmatos_ZCMA.PRE.1